MSNIFYIHFFNILDFFNITFNICQIKMILYIVCLIYFKASNKENDEHDIITGILNEVFIRIKKNNIYSLVFKEVIILNKEIFK